jgi:hypothetical protein
MVRIISSLTTIEGLQAPGEAPPCRVNSASKKCFLWGWGGGGGTLACLDPDPQH